MEGSGAQTKTMNSFLVLYYVKNSRIFPVLGGNFSSHMTSIRFLTIFFFIKINFSKFYQFIYRVIKNVRRFVKECNNSLHNPYSWSSIGMNSRETVSLWNIFGAHDVLPEGRRRECRPGWVSVRRTQTFYSQTAAPETWEKLYLKAKSHNITINLIQYFLNVCRLRSKVLII